MAPSVQICELAGHAGCRGLYATHIAYGDLHKIFVELTCCR